MSSGSTMSRRLATAGVCVLSLVVCCGLAWWQWDRYTSAGGSFQNLGYVLQWPLFGAFPLFMVWRIRRLRQQPRAKRLPVEPEPDRRSTTAAVPAVVARPGPERPDHQDDELAAYNRYLAELNARDQKGN